MRTPTSFLRATTRLLLFQTLAVWLRIQVHYLPLARPFIFILSPTIGMYINDAKEVLDAQVGFALPWEATFFLPAALDE